MSTVIQDIERARETFRRHEAMKTSSNTWMLRRPDSGNFWTEIIAGSAGTLIIHGDGPDLILRSYRRDGTVEYLVRWASTGGLDYIGSKVACGEREVYVGALAKEEFEAWLEESRDEGEEDYLRGTNLLSGLIWEDHQEVEMREALANALPDMWECRFGWRPSWNLIAARAACKRLVEIWEGA